MPSALRSLALVALAASAVEAGTLSVPIVRRAEPVPATLARRDGTIDLDALNNVTGGGYYAQFGIGTPPQQLTFQLDTGSSDTWANSVGTGFCKNKAAQAKTGAWCLAVFNPNASSTFEVVDQGGFNITYLDGRHISGDYFNDSVTIDGKEVKNQQLGVALKSVRQTGLMGLGFSANVATDKKYPTVIDNMVSQGIIDAPFFSLYLNDLDAKSGTILFGGIDSQKYFGNLTTLRLLADNSSAPDGNITSYQVHLQGLDVDGVTLGSLDAGAILDSGSTISLLPDRQAQAIFSHFGIRSIKEVPLPLVDCAYRGSKGKGTNFSFKFSGKTIKVPIDEMVINAFADNVQNILKNSVYAPQFSGWENVCLFGIGSAYDYGVTSDSFALLGDTFLRSAYVAYDMANFQLGLAQANVNADKSNIIEIKKGAKDLPSVAGVAEKSAAGRLGPSAGFALAGTLLMAVAAVVSTL